MINPFNKKTPCYSIQEQEMISIGIAGMGKYDKNLIHLSKLISTPVIVFSINYDMINANV